MSLGISHSNESDFDQGSLRRHDAQPHSSRTASDMYGVEGAGVAPDHSSQDVVSIDETCRSSSATSSPGSHA